MKLIHLSLSPAQKSKIRNGKPVKVNPKHKSITGEGVGMLVDENKYNALTRKFDSNKGLLFKLSASEIEANKNLDKIADDDVKAEMSGNGLFESKKTKATTRKTAKAIKKIVDGLEGETDGKGLLKQAKKVVKKGTKKAVKAVKSEAKDIAGDVKKEAEEGLKKPLVR